VVWAGQVLVLTLGAHLEGELQALVFNTKQEGPHQPWACLNGDTKHRDKNHYVNICIPLSLHPLNTSYLLAISCASVVALLLV